MMFFILLGFSFLFTLCYIILASKNAFISLFFILILALAFNFQSFISVAD